MEQEPKFKIGQMVSVKGSFSLIGEIIDIISVFDPPSFVYKIKYKEDEIKPAMSIGYILHCMGDVLPEKYLTSSMPRVHEY